MTKIYLSENDTGFHFKAAGHADKRAGEDVNLCCAGESMLTQAVLKACGDMAEEGMLIGFDYKKQSGEISIKIECCDTPECRGELAGIKRTLKAGLELLSERYPDQIIRGEK